MNNEVEFQITLPSNSSLKYSPDNKSSNFTTTLPAPITLEGEWEVALIDLQYPHNWMNIPNDVYILYGILPSKKGTEILKDMDDSFTFSLTAYANQIKEELEFSKQVNFLQEKLGKVMAVRLPRGYYNSVKDLVSVVNKGIQEELSRSDDHAKGSLREIDIIYDLNPITRTMRLVRKGMTKLVTICHDKRVKAILDLASTEPTGKDEVVIEEKVLIATTTSIYVYTDIIKYQYVGDAKVPLLGVLPVQGSDGEQCYWSFQPPYYIPLSMTTLAAINMQLSDDTGEEIPFAKDGKVVARLHFRRVRSML